MDTGADPGTGFGTPAQPPRQPMTGAAALSWHPPFCPPATASHLLGIAHPEGDGVEMDEAASQGLKGRENRAESCRSLSRGVTCCWSREERQPRPCKSPANASELTGWNRGCCPETAIFQSTLRSGPAGSCSAGWKVQSPDSPGATLVLVLPVLPASSIGRGTTPASIAASKINSQPQTLLHNCQRWHEFPFDPLLWPWLPAAMHTDRQL